MNAEVEVLLQPYDAREGRSILHRLIDEFESGRWTEFRGAVHFAKRSGNFDELLGGIESFLRAGGVVKLTFGADVFGKNNFATDHDAILELLRAFEAFPGFSLTLYHERARTFHPKVYLFSREEEEALLIVGSSNWSEGGFYNNVEANVVVRLNLATADQRACFDRVVACFEENWQESA